MTRFSGADMEEQDEAVPSAEPPRGVGPQLRAAREAKGLSLQQVAAQTRIPQRHLEVIETGDFSRLPGRTYAVGFSRTYAKTVDLDQDDVVAMVRAELDEKIGAELHHRPAPFEPGDPARVPSRGLGWFAIFALVLFLVGGFFFFRVMFAPAGELPSLVEQQEAEQAATSAAATERQARQPRGAIDPGGQVVFTAMEEGIWVRFYDAGGRLMEKLMARGERYAVPVDARGPMLWTGRPDALAITIGGRDVPRLADDDVVMRDVPVTAEALLARQQPATAPAGDNPAVPAT
jgi:cytoskeleton protein RodZ